MHEAVARYQPEEHDPDDGDPDRASHLLSRVEHAGSRAGIPRVHAREDDVEERRDADSHPQPAQGHDAEEIYGPLAGEMQQLYTRYTNKELALILDFLERSREIGQRGITRIRAGR